MQMPIHSEKIKTPERKMSVNQVQQKILHWKVMRNAGPREKREGCCNTIMPSAAHALFTAEELSQSGLSRVGLEIRPQEGKYRATSGTVLGRLGLAWSCPYCTSVWNFPQPFTEAWPSWPPASGSGRGHRAPDCSAGCPTWWGLTRCQGHSGWRTGCAPPP